MIDSLIIEMKAFCEQFGLSYVEDNPSLTIEDIIEFQKRGLVGKSSEEIEEFVFKAHSFNTLLKSKRSSLRAFVRGLDGLVDSYVARGLDGVDKFLPFPMKRELILSADQDMVSISSKLNMAKMQLDKIAELPEGIDSTLRSLENRMRRRNG